MAAYLAAMLVNPNNHALDGGPGASELEVEVVAELATMLGLPDRALGPPVLERHDREPRGAMGRAELRPGKRIVHSAEAHYTHGRMCRVLGVEATEVPASPGGASTWMPSRPSAAGRRWEPWS